MRQIHILFLCFLNFLSCLAQSELGSILAPPHNKYNHFVKEDSQGFIWIGSEEGVYKYSSCINDFKHYPIRNNLDGKDGIFPITQSSFYFDNQENIWFTIPGYLIVIRRKSDKVEYFNFPTDTSSPQLTYAIIHHNKNNNTLWLVADDQIWKFNTTNYSYESLQHRTKGVRFATDTSQNGSLQTIVSCPWDNQNGIELFILDPNDSSWNKSIITSQNSSILPKVSSAVFISHNDVIITTELGIGKYSIKEKKFNLLEITNNYCRSSLIQSGFYYAADPKTGIWRTPINENNDLVIDNTENIISTKGIVQIHPSTHGAIWACFDKSGVRRITTKANPVFENIFSGNNVVGLNQKSDSSIIAITSNGETYLSSPPFTESTLSDLNIKDEEILKINIFAAETIIITKENVWSSSETESPILSRGNLGINKIINYQELDSAYSLLLTYGSIYLFNNDTLQHSDFLQEFTSFEFDYLKLLPGNRISLYHSSGSVWILSFKEGKFIVISKTKIPGDINTIYANSGSESIWIGTNNGLWEISNDSIPKKHILLFDIAPYSIESILSTPSGELIIGTNKGLIKYYPDKKSSEFYGIDDGLLSEKFSREASILDRHGYVWMANETGLVRFHPDSLIPSSNWLNPHIKDLWINNLPYESNSNSLSEITELRLAYWENNLDIYLSANEHPANTKTSLLSTLIGYDSTAKISTVCDFVKFPQIPAGDYTLEVIAINGNGQKAGKKYINIKIVPALWNRTWFRISALLTIALIIGGIYTWLLRRELAKQARIQENLANISAERDRIASEVHDDLGGQLSSILFLSEGLSMEAELPAEVQPQIIRIHELSKSSLHNVRDIIFALDNRRSTLSDFLQRMEQHGRTFFADRGVTFNYRIEVSDTEIILTSRQKRNLGQIIKEAYHNAFKHAEADWVQLKAEQDKTGIMFTISDDGKGFTPPIDLSNMEGTTGSFGLENMYKKAQVIQADLKIHSQPGAGTTISILWSLPSNTST